MTTIGIPPADPIVRYVKSVNGIRPDESGDVTLTNLAPTTPEPAQKVLVLSPNQEMPSLAGLAEGTLVVRLKSTPSSPVTSAANVVLLNPLDPEPVASSVTNNTLVLRLLTEA